MATKKVIRKPGVKFKAHAYGVEWFSVHGTTMDHHFRDEKERNALADKFKSGRATSSIMELKL